MRCWQRQGMKLGRQRVLRTIGNDFSFLLVSYRKNTGTNGKSNKSELPFKDRQV
jgi:hypothetical protein